MQLTWSVAQCMSNKLGLLEIKMLETQQSPLPPTQLVMGPIKCPQDPLKIPGPWGPGTHYIENLFTSLYDLFGLCQFYGLIIVISLFIYYYNYFICHNQSGEDKRHGHDSSGRKKRNIYIYMYNHIRLFGIRFSADCFLFSVFGFGQEFPIRCIPSIYISETHINIVQSMLILP